MRKTYLPLFIGVLLIVGVAFLRLTARVARNSDVTISIESPNSAPQEITYSAEILSNNADAKIWPLWIELCLFGPINIALLGIGIYLYIVIKDFIEFLKNLIALIATIITAIALILIAGTSVSDSYKKAEELIQPTPTVIVLPTSIPSTPTLIPLDKNQNLYYLDVNIIAPEVIKQGQSDVVKISLGIYDTKPKDNKFQPIELFRRGYFYGIPEIQAVNFTIPSESNVVDNKQRIELNKITTWNWILTPTDVAEGNQSILWHIAIDDGRNKDELLLVTLTVKINVQPKYGIPSYLLNPNFSLVGLIIGILTFVLGFAKLQQEKER